MLNRIILITALFSTSLLFSAQEEVRHSFKLGVGFSGYPIGHGIAIDIATPRLFSITSDEGKRRSDIHLQLGVEDLLLPNSVTVAGQTVSVSTFVFNLGFKGQMIPHEGVISPYSLLAMDLLLPDSRTSTKSTAFGLRVAFGCDFFFRRGEDSFLGTSDSSFFVEGAVFFWSHALDKVGPTDWFNGFAPRVGFRAHF
jgi:hypothetical protein